ncbi:hypothetical protein FGO68_gene320 [Halteria grandinella]|uniref:Bulb-type lectin domain-containing protein n=1 Tax=Halteria grandinella TaxID=5974 RepID=A0A8J8NJD0_HALGN|nr:hypothetical protein FGO68_gene320 [Halteria grandinella]
MKSNESLISTNECFQFIYQTDGNLVIYVSPYTQVPENSIWHARQSRQVSLTRRLCMQTDGNLVSYEQTSALWNSRTAGRGTQPYTLVMQDDGNLCIYDSNKGLVWQSNSPQKVVGTCKSSSFPSSNPSDTINSQNITIGNLIQASVFLVGFIAMIIGLLLF